MFVTAYYDIYNKPNAFTNYLNLFNDLASSGLPITIFTDPSLVDKFRIFPCNLKVLGMPLESFELYSICKNYNGALPNHRNTQKDTKEFLALMNTKPEFIKKAAEILNDDTFIWIDFGILKIVKNTELFIQTLKLVNEKKYEKITIPGCWEINSPFSLDRVNWRFCGGFFIMPRHHIDTFYNHCKTVITDFCTLPQYKLTWETNVWFIAEFSGARDIIDWYLADHDDSIILNITNLINL